jgi:hypothetical protein
MERLEFEFPQGQEFSPLRDVQTGSGFYPTSYPVGKGALFSSVVKQPRREDDHSPPAIAEVKKIWIYTSTPIAFMA